MKETKMSYNDMNQQELIEKLKDDAQADAYFYEILEKCKISDQQQAKEQLMVALKNITHAQGGFANFLSQSGAESFYKIISSVILKFVR